MKYNKVIHSCDVCNVPSSVSDCSILPVFFPVLYLTTMGKSNISLTKVQYVAMLTNYVAY